MQPTTNSRGRSRQRVLYWFRTPPNIRVGRGPFDPAAQRALEARYPDVAFDWQKLIDTPVPPPPPDVERWRERRKIERAAKQAAREEEAAEAAAAAQAVTASSTDSPEAPSEAAPDTSPDADGADELPSTADFVVSSTEPLSTASEGQAALGAPNPLRRRRRRRRRGGGGNRPETPRE